MLQSRDTRYGVFSNWRAVCAVLVVFGLFGTIAPTHGEVLHLADGVGGTTGQSFGRAMAGIPDISGDGLSELLVGAPMDNFAGQEAGAAFLWLGNTAVTEQAHATWHGEAGERFGFAVAWIGDVNNGGEPDYAVGAPLSNAGTAASGRVCVFYGEEDPATGPHLVIQGASAGNQFGFSLADAGDFDGDGRDDFIVGAPYSNAPGLQSGAAYVIYGADGGPSVDLDDALKLSGLVAGDLFGWSVAGAGNFLGGNEDAVAVGAPSYDSIATDAGAVFIFEGANHPTNPDADYDHRCQVGGNAKPNSLFGTVVRNVGRWDSDGYDDLAIGAPGNSFETGRVGIFFGDASPSVEGDRYRTGQDGEDQFGHCVVGGYDWTGNGKADVLIGAPHQSADGSDAGRAYIWEGGTGSGSAGSLDIIAVDPMVEGNTSGGLFGYSLAACADFDGDGQPDHGIGAPAGNISFNNSPAGYCRFMATDPQTVANEPETLNFGWQPGGAVMVQIRWSGEWSTVDDLKVYRREEMLGGDSIALTLVHEGRVPANTTDVFELTDPGPFHDPGAHHLTYHVEMCLEDGSSQLLENGATLALADRPEPNLLAGAVWPNPANPQAAMEFQVPAGQAFMVTVHDLRGHEVALVRQGHGSGLPETAVWDGRDAQGRQLPSGTYFFRLLAGLETQVRKVVLAR